jgi:Alpha/beta hydrolase of unknown function (DUF900)
VSRFQGLPLDYDPWLLLSVREAPEGGTLALQVNCDPPYPPTLARELVVLVHGFNNHMGEAAEAYQGFRHRQYPLAGVVPPALESNIGDFFWPGDADWAGLFDKTDFLVYPSAVKTAPHTGERLARYIAALPNLLVVNFVAHSLGCRVVLECVRQLLTTNHPIIRRIVLMAAAVPDFMVSVGGILASATQAADSVLVLHSTSDAVLHYTFPPGQTISGSGEGFLPTALGRFGPPAGMTGKVQGYRINDAGHGDYWGVKGDDVSPLSDSVRDIVAGYIAESLQLGNVARSLPPASRPDRRTPVGFARTISGMRALSVRSTGAN